MIITRTPFRVSFFGGGTDYPVWYEENGGAVLSATINKYCYINCRFLPPFFDFKYRIRYTTREEIQSPSEIKHPSVRECIKYFGVDHGIEMVHTSDLPAQSGLGSSSSFTVGFLNALYALTGKMISKRQLAQGAIHIEQEMIKENVGSQDQVAAAFGGFNKISFRHNGAGEFNVEPVTISQDKLMIFQRHLLLFFTGFSRNASDIAGEQIKRTPEKKVELKTMMELVDVAISTLNDKKDLLDDFGRLLHEQWMIKRSMTSLISNPHIDEIYDAGRRAGALGGKLLGAGGGGFMLFFVKPEHRGMVKEALKNILFVPFSFEFTGSQVVYFVPQDKF